MLKTIMALATASVAIIAVSSMGGCSKGGIDVVTVVEDAQKVCKFVPSVESVVAVLAANPVIGTAEAAVAAICDGINSWVANQPPPPPGTVNAPFKKEVEFDMFIKGQKVHVTGKRL